MGFHLLVSTLVVSFTFTTAEICKNDVLSTSSNKFSSVLFKVIRSSNQNENLICSAWSAHMALSMLQQGADKDTDVLMKQSLHLPDDNNVIRKSFKDFMDCFSNSKSEVLDVANKMFVNKQFVIKDDYKKVTEEIFKAEASGIDVNDPTSSAGMINSWVENKTRNKIKNIIGPNDIGKDSNLILVNAVYFKSMWKTKFDKCEVLKFFVHQNQEVEVPFMYVKHMFLYGYAEEVKAEFIVLPYENKDYEMVIMLPDKEINLNEMEQNLDSLNYTELENKAYEKNVELYMPKFEFESTIYLEEALREIGLGEIFASPNLNKISDNQLKVSKIVQKAFIDVNEDGTEAAAATAMVFKRSLDVSKEASAKIFRIERPFCFFIRKAETIIFQGHVYNPNLNKKKSC